MARRIPYRQWLAIYLKGKRSSGRSSGRSRSYGRRSRSYGRRRRSYGRRY